MKIKKDSKKRQAFVAALRKAVAKMRAEMWGEGSEKESEEENGGGGEEGRRAYGALRKAREVTTFGAGRKCKCCKCALAASNPVKFCEFCDSVIAEWENFPWNRAEIKQRMAKHCLDYVREKAARKKARCGVPRDISSGSFTRAVGRREIGKKVKKSRR